MAISIQAISAPFLGAPAKNALAAPRPYPCFQVLQSESRPSSVDRGKDERGPIGQGVHAWGG
eukprot:6991852-Alexandrium_andersonii.AAC.1